MTQSIISPFCGIRPASEFADKVIAPPYDVVNRLEAKTLAKANPWSFLHISKPEIDFPDEVSDNDPRVFKQAAAQFADLKSTHVLIQDQKKSFYVYQLQQGAAIQTGLVCLISTQAYETGRFKRHELTFPHKESGRVNNILALQAQTSPVLGAYRYDPHLTTILTKTTQLKPLYEVSDHEQVIHRLWQISNIPEIQLISETINAMPGLYIADGHHRAAAAVKASQQVGNPDAKQILTALFPDAELTISGYHRFIHDIAPFNQETFLTAIENTHTVLPLEKPSLPEKLYQMQLYLKGQWYQLNLKELLDSDSTIDSLDVSVLSNTILAPWLSITDLRSDPRISCIGGEKSLSVLQACVDREPNAAAFVLYPTHISQLFAVADEQQIMPPKSTWFSPKLADGLMSYQFDGVV